MTCWMAAAGADRMIGGTGDDTYIVDNAGDVVDETGGDGVDTVQSAISFSLADTAHALGAIENLTLTGKTSISGTGNDLDNILIGNSASNVLIGLGGNDYLDGGAGADRMIGGTGDDTYVVDNAGDVVDETGWRWHRHGSVLGQLQPCRSGSRWWAIVEWLMLTGTSFDQWNGQRS